MLLVDGVLGLEVVIREWEEGWGWGWGKEKGAW